MSAQTEADDSRAKDRSTWGILTVTTPPGRADWTTHGDAGGRTAHTGSAGPAVSVLVELKDGVVVAAATFGREGMVGLSVFLGGGAPTEHTQSFFTQLARRCLPCGACRSMQWRRR